MLRKLATIAILGLLGFNYLSGGDQPLTSRLATTAGQAFGFAESALWNGDDASHSGSHTFMETNADGSPARWNPCAPIPYVLNAPDLTAVADAQEAIRRISAASGLQFAFVGPTSAVPTSTWAQTRFDGRPGWAPLAIAWATPDRTDLLDGEILGIGGPDTLDTAAGHVIVSGSVVIDSTKNVTPGFATGTSRGALLMHELAHAVGLGHTDDDSQIMEERLGGAPAAYGAGDLAGLARLGQGGCLDAPRPAWG